MQGLGAGTNKGSKLYCLLQNVMANYVQQVQESLGVFILLDYLKKKKRFSSECYNYITKTKEELPY